MPYNVAPVRTSSPSPLPLTFTSTPPASTWPCSKTKAYSTARQSTPDDGVGHQCNTFRSTSPKITKPHKTAPRKPSLAARCCGGSAPTAITAKASVLRHSTSSMCWLNTSTTSAWTPSSTRKNSPWGCVPASTRTCWLKIVLSCARCTPNLCGNNSNTSTGPSNYAASTHLPPPTVASSSSALM